MSSTPILKVSSQFASILKKPFSATQLKHFSKMWHLRLLRPAGVGIAALGLILAAAVTRANLLGGLTGTNDPISGFLCPTPLQPAIIDCHTDCREQHNSTTGSCNNEGNCICSGPGVPHDTFSLLSCRYNFSLSTLPAPLETPVCQCLSDSTPVLYAFFSRACNSDCRCLHGAAGGSCDWANTACICDYPPGYVWTAPERVICTADVVANLTACVAQALVTGVDPPGC